MGNVPKTLASGTRLSGFIRAEKSEVCEGICKRLFGTLLYDGSAVNEKQLSALKPADSVLVKEHFRRAPR